MNITICGGGSLGHVCLGVLSCKEETRVSLLTNQPDKWQKRIIVTDANGDKYEGEIQTISADPADVIPGADLVLICLPGYAIEKELQKIKPYIQEVTIVGSIVSSTGFFFAAHSILPYTTKLFGFQRVPFIARTDVYGKSAQLLGYKISLSIATENIAKADAFREEIERLFSMPTTLLNSFYEAALTNSNPILHTGRLYTMWHDWDGVPKQECLLLYKTWDVASAQCIIDMDNEFMQLLQVLGIKGSIPSLLAYYESTDAESLSHKLQRIKAFETIPAPMKEANGGWIPDFESRYFTEDFPFGLKYIHDLAHEHNVACPNIDKVFEWGMSKVNS